MTQPPDVLSQPIASDILLYLPFFGLLIIAIALFSLLFQRERFIIAGSITGVILLMAGLFVFQYSVQIKSAVARYRTPVETTPRVEPQIPAPKPAAEKPAAPTAEEVAKDTSDTRERGEPIAPPKKRLVAVDRSVLDGAGRREDDESGELSIISEPATQKRPSAPEPTISVPLKKPSVRPEPEPSKVSTIPAPAPSPAPVVIPTPAPVPAPRPVTPAPTAPAGDIRVAVAGPGANKGNLKIVIKGPLLEISKTHNKDAHLMIILDGRLKQIVYPTRDRKDFMETDMGQKGEITSITYFWENINVTFENLQAGPHSVMIDLGLMDKNTHASQMIGSGNLDNDWNGFVDVNAGKTTEIVFGTKNWMSQKLDRLK